ncbi:MAG: hypothetical protein P8013_07855 [Candidatus Sulfobium sp.]|jgi:hypothetical protein
MSAKERPLPKPPGKKFYQEQDNTRLLADKIAEAVAQGKLDEFMKSEIPDSEQARTLVSMMMGMTGMLPPHGLKDEAGEGSSGIPPEKGSEEAPPSSEPPQDAREAAHAGDTEKLVEILKREHGRRGDSTPDAGCEEQTGSATIERADIDRLLRIASENGLSPDWIILRAIRLYIREYERTGRL